MDANSIVFESVSYDSKNGCFTWERRPTAHFKSQGDANKWNARHAGKGAGRIVSKGYEHITISGKTWKSHQLVFLFETGSIPPEIDHIDGNKTNNVFANLRAVSHGENCRNQRLHKHNTSGHVGVSFDATARKWIAFITVKGRLQRLGYFPNKEQAIEARLAANVLHGFHPNHGMSAVRTSQGGQ